MKSIISWAIALFISIMVIWMFWRLFFLAVSFTFAVVTNIVVIILAIFVAIPFYLIIRKKFIK